MASEIELPPCPWCGGQAERIVMVRAKRPDVQEFEWEPLSSYEQKFMFRCAGGKCPVMPETVLCDTPEEAAELWSRRAQPPTVIQKDKPCLALRPAGNEDVEAGIAKPCYSCDTPNCCFAGHGHLMICEHFHRKEA